MVDMSDVTYKRWRAEAAQIYKDNDGKGFAVLRSALKNHLSNASFLSNGTTYGNHVEYNNFVYRMAHDNGVVLKGYTVRALADTMKFGALLMLIFGNADIAIEITLNKLKMDAFGEDALKTTAANIRSAIKSGSYDIKGEDMGISKANIEEVNIVDLAIATASNIRHNNPDIAFEVVLSKAVDAIKEHCVVTDHNAKVLDAAASVITEAKVMSTRSVGTPVATVANSIVPVVEGAKGGDASSAMIPANIKTAVDSLLKPIIGKGLDDIANANAELVTANTELRKEVEVLKKAASRPMVSTSASPVKGGGAVPDGKQVAKKAGDVFGVKSKVMAFDVPTFEWDGDHPSVPALMDDYKFDPSSMLKLLKAVVFNEKSYLIGHTGTGKSTMVEQMAARLGWPVERINLDSNIERANFVGHTVLVNDGGTTVSKWVDGNFVRAMKNGYLVILDEIDFGRSDILYVLQSVLEGGSLLISETGERVYPHANFRLFATANTKGQGDVMGLYQGARILSTALLNRFTCWVDVDYMKDTDEVELLKGRYATIKEDIIKQVVAFAKEIRTAFKNGEIVFAMSPRETQALCSDFQFFSGLMPEPKALKISMEKVVYSKSPDDSKARISEIAKRVFASAPDIGSSAATDVAF